MPTKVELWNLQQQNNALLSILSTMTNKSRLGFNQISEMAQVSSKTLAERLPELLQGDLIVRDEDGKYDLTAKGRASLGQLESGMATWEENRKNAEAWAKHNQIEVVSEASPVGTGPEIAFTAIVGSIGAAPIDATSQERIRQAMVKAGTIMAEAMGEEASRVKTFNFYVTGSLAGDNS